MARAGIKPAEVAKPDDPFKERRLNLQSKLRDIIFNLRNDATVPNPANKVCSAPVAHARASLANMLGSAR